MAGDSKHHRLHKYDCTLPDGRNLCFAHFDLLNMESAVKSTPTSLSESTADVRRIQLRENVSKDYIKRNKSLIKTSLAV